MTQFIIKDPTASVRTRAALNSLTASIVQSLRSQVLTEVTAAITMALTSGVTSYTVAVTGAAVGSIVIITPLTLPHSSVASWAGLVSAQDTVTIRIFVSGGPGGFVIQPLSVAVLGV